MNNPNGMYQVGYCYYLGIGVKMNKHKAFKYYLKAAKAGNSMGIFKTAICYYYGVGVKKNKDKYYYWTEKNSNYGKCAHCNKYNTKGAWCQTCDPDITVQEWTSGNKDIDDCVKGFQLRTTGYERMIEWIPFDRLNNIEKIGEGGFGSVFSATWLDGIRKIEFDYDNDKFIKAREPSSVVALKTLSGSRKNSLDFLNEFSNHIKCRLYGSELKMYGLTQNTETNEYFMVFQYANNGSLYKFLRTKFQDITWQTKLKLLKDISLDLRHIHNAGYIHADFHSGNILQDEEYEGISKSIKSYISDLGLSKKKNRNDLEGGTYGVLPYVAPEVLLGQKFTPAADIYSFGVIMSEMSTGQRPFDGRPFDLSLTLDIYRGLRPEFAPGTPDCYIELAKQCMDSDPQKRPDALDIWVKCNEWNEIMKSSDNANEIKNQFLEADKIVKALPIISPKHPDFMYTSKIINTQKISNAIEALPSNPIDSVEILLIIE
ncbi:kinase-like domain-containing protein [Gigaspora rosea]|uniref:Kinase-like domain-containing protein n=1 Tax=Gigaspora rosea TaxID=44941 RepID=A0A397UAU2_9GLOM|nr:kinase-like domain-containing protein [Gigaspora rosea]